MVCIGDKIRQLREAKGITRSEFCGTESDLTTRQLMRIENGESSPNIETIQWIAEVLEVPTYQLMLDYYELPSRYKELKYLVLRQPAYGNRELWKQKDHSLEEIYREFYDELPAEEQEVVSCLKSYVQVVLTNDIRHGLWQLEQVMPAFKDKTYFALNDLFYIRLLALCASIGQETGSSLSPHYLLLLEDSLELLLEQSDFFEPEHLFVYNNCLFTCLSFYDSISDYSAFKKSVEVLTSTLDKTQDFQKKPLLLMLEWKLALFEENDFSKATTKYQETTLLAQVLGLSSVSAGLDYEWKTDVEKYYKA